MNLLFIISWGLHKLEVSVVNEEPNVSVYQRVKPTKKKTGRLKVEVFNACNVDGVARKMTNYLRRSKIDVVFYGNYETANNKIFIIPQTLVIDRKDESRTNAKKIANIIGVRDEYIIYQLSPQRQVDVTILIGKNYSVLKAFK